MMATERLHKFDINPDPELFERYLKLLETVRQKPSYDALAELVATQMKRVPFENISKLYYKKHLGLQSLPDLKLYLDGIERYNFGGTCYSNNYYLYMLLKHLGYDIILCGADMANPDVHIVSLVTVDGREYLVDTGYAAPFVTPIPRDLDEDYILVWGDDTYLLKPRDNQGYSRMELHRNGQAKHGYVIKPVPRSITHFATAIEDSYRAGATFMNAILLARFDSECSVAIHNLSIIETDRIHTRISKLGNRKDLLGAIKEHFSIPQEIACDAIADIAEFGDAWS